MPLLRDIQRSSKFLQLNLVLLAALLVALSMFLWPHWNENPDLSHGFFMPLLFLLLLHESRSHGTLRFLPPHPIKTALTLLTIAAGLFIMGAAGLYAVTVGWSHTLVAFFLTSSACLFFFAGLLTFSDSRVALLPLNWTSLVAIGLWLLCAPLPPGTYSRLTLTLQLSVTDHVLSALHLLGIAASQHGNVIELAKTTVGVEEACSGVRSLISCVFAGFFFSATLVRRFWPRLIIVGLAAPLALIMNFARSLILTLLANAGIDISGTWHDVTGFAVLGITAAILGGLALLLDQKTDENAARKSTPEEKARSAGVLHTGLTVGLLLAASLNIFFYAKTRPAPPSNRIPPNLLSILPAKSEGWHVDTSTDLYQFSGILQTENLAQRTYRRVLNGEVAIFTVYLAYWQPGQSSVSQVSMHTPDACWPGSGWDPVEVPSRREALQIPARELPVAESRKFTTGRFFQNVWFWHIYDRKPIDFVEPRSALELLRHAWHYGFTNESDQMFARFSSNLNWDQLKDEPLMQEIFRNLKPLGL